MKKLVTLGIALAVALLVQPAAHSNNAAIVIKPGGLCGLFDGDGGIGLTLATQIVATQSANGNAHLKCQAQVPNSTGKAVKYDFKSTGLLCGVSTPFGFAVTDNWHETVSASGKATLVCHLP